MFSSGSRPIAITEPSSRKQTGPSRSTNGVSARTGSNPSGTCVASLLGLWEREALQTTGRLVRLETTYLFNPHLNNFRIHSQIEEGNVLLTETVGTEIDTSLAVEIAKSLDGIHSVKDQLIVSRDAGTAAHTSISGQDRTFVQEVGDATTAARYIAHCSLSPPGYEAVTSRRTTPLWRGKFSLRKPTREARKGHKKRHKRVLIVHCQEESCIFYVYRTPVQLSRVGVRSLLGMGRGSGQGH